MILVDDREYDMLKRMLKSFMPFFDALYVSINGPGSTKKIEGLLKKYKAKYEVVGVKEAPELFTEYSSTYKEYKKMFSKRDGGLYAFTNFAAARNRSWDLVDKKFDYLCWADIDDVLIAGDELRLAAEAAKSKEADMVFFTYWYAVKTKIEKGKEVVEEVIIDHIRERLIVPGKFKWTSRLHEVVVPIADGYEPKLINYDYDEKKERFCRWIHLPPVGQPAVNLKRNGLTLEIQVREEEAKDPRTLYYLAKTYFDANNPQKDVLAVELLKRYLEMSGWAQERANALEYLALIYIRRGQKREAIDILHQSIKEFPGSHMIYLRLANEYYETKDIQKFKIWLDIVMKMDPPKADTTIGNPFHIKLMIAALKYNEATLSQDIKNMVYWLAIRADLTKQEDDKKKVYELKELYDRNEIAKKVWEYSKWLKDTGNIDKVTDLLKSMPFELGREPFAFFISNQVAKPKVWGKKSIVYVANFGSEHFEPWGPGNLKTGIGGSETAVIQLSKEWVKQGYDVTVFGDPREEEGVHDGVNYRPWYEMNWGDIFNILILWRNPFLLDKDISAKKLFLDLHDVASNLDYTKKRVKKLDMVFVKSKYHRKMLPNVPDSKISIIGNGI